MLRLRLITMHCIYSLTSDCIHTHCTIFSTSNYLRKSFCGCHVSLSNTKLPNTTPPDSEQWQSTRQALLYAELIPLADSEARRPKTFKLFVCFALQNSLQRLRILGRYGTIEIVLLLLLLLTVLHCVSKNAPLGILSISLPNIKQEQSERLQDRSMQSINRKCLCSTK